MQDLIKILGEGERGVRGGNIDDGHDCPIKSSCPYYDSSCGSNFERCSRYNCSKEQKVR